MRIQLVVSDSLSRHLHISDVRPSLSSLDLVYLSLAHLYHRTSLSLYRLLLRRMINHSGFDCLIFRPWISKYVYRSFFLMLTPLMFAPSWRVRELTSRLRLFCLSANLYDLRLPGDEDNYSVVPRPIRSRPT